MTEANTQEPTTSDIQLETIETKNLHSHFKNNKNVLVLGMLAFLAVIGSVVFASANSIQKLQARADVIKYIIYDDSLATGWAYKYSRRAQVNLAVTNHVYSGSKSISFSPYGRRSTSFFLHTNTALNTEPYVSLHFAVRYTKSNQNYAVILRDQYDKDLGAALPLKAFESKATTPGWTVYDIPLINLNAVNKQVSGLVLENITSPNQSTIFIDEIQLVSANGSAIPTNLPTPFPTIVPIPTSYPTPTPFIPTPTFACIGSTGCPISVVPTNAPTPTRVPVVTTTPAPVSGSGNWWKPGPTALEWQWEIGNPLDVTSLSQMGTGKTAFNGATAPSTDPVVYDIDGFDNTAATVSKLHSMGKKVVCYIEVGADDGRSDSPALKATGEGNAVPGWPEKFINITNPTVVTIIKARIAMCAQKGFDAIEPDLDESYASNTGFPLTKAIEESYMTNLANYAHSLGVAMWGKNPDDTGDSYAADMVNVFDAVLTEECNEYATCDALSAYTGKKPIFNAEYSLSTGKFCAADNARTGWNGAQFNLDLTGTRNPCR